LQFDRLFFAFQIKEVGFIGKLSALSSKELVFVAVVGTEASGCIAVVTLGKSKVPTGQKA
jgi:hypothetical protein